MAEPEEDEEFDEVFGETWLPWGTPKYSLAEKRRRGTWWQRVRRRLKERRRRVSRAA